MRTDFLTLTVSSVVLLSLFITGTSRGQVLNMQFPEAGDTLVLDQIIPASVLDFNSSGVGAVWDFTAAAVLETERSAFQNPDGLPFSQDFPSADLGAHMYPRDEIGFGSYSFFRITEEAVTQIGITFNDEESIEPVLAMSALNPVDWFRLPLSLNMSFSDTGIFHATANGLSVGLPIDSVSATLTCFRHDTIDALGTVILSDQTFENVFRKVMTDIYIDSLFSFDAQNQSWELYYVEPMTVKRYYWISQEGGFTVAKAILEGDGYTRIYTVPQFVDPQVYNSQAHLNLYGDTVIAGQTVIGLSANVTLLEDSTLNESYSGSLQLFLVGQNGPVNILGASSSQAVNGTAQFAPIKFNGPEGHFTLYVLGEGIVPTGRLLYLMPEPEYVVRLEFHQLSDTAMNNMAIPDFEVRAVNIADGSLAESFNGPIVLRSVAWPSNIDTADAVSGIATITGFQLSTTGPDSIYAFSEGVEEGLQRIILQLPPTALDFTYASMTVASNETLAPFEVVIRDSLGNRVSIDGIDVRLGKAEGPGNMLGTHSASSAYGKALFNDLTFSCPGTYRIVALTDTTFSSDTMTVEVFSHPWEMMHYHRTDSLTEFVNRALFWIYEVNADGYLSGTSRDWYTEIAQRFDFNGNGRVVRVLLYFSLVNQYTPFGAPSDSITVKIYGSGLNYVDIPWPYFSENLPTDLLGKQTFSTNDIVVSDYFNQEPTVVSFSVPVDVCSDFHVALEVNRPGTVDTVALWISVPGDGQDERRTTRLTTPGTGGSASAYWLTDRLFRPSYDVDLMIIPVLEIDTSSLVVDGSFAYSVERSALAYPNPTNGIVTVDLADIEIVDHTPFQLTDVLGKSMTIQPIERNGSLVRFNLSHLPDGIYILHSNGSKGVNARIVIQQF
jgi:hypothetical protein